MLQKKKREKTGIKYSTQIQRDLQHLTDVKAFDPK